MTDREKLIELIGREIVSYLADLLLSSGVTFATDTNVGDKWISVEERLPKSDNETVLIARNYRGKRYVESGTIHANGEAFCYSDEYKANPREHLVTHWMPLPEPPLDTTNQAADL